MNVSMFLGFFIFAVVTIYFSFELWTNPKAFLRKRREARLRAYKSKLGFLIQNPYAKGFDRSQQLELWVARAGFVLIYIFIAYGLVVAITGKK